MSENGEPMRVSRYRPSPAIDRLTHQGDDHTRRFREAVVEALRTATTDVMNNAIEESGADLDPGNAISSEGYHAGLVEGFVEAVYHDLAALIGSGFPMEDLLLTLEEIQSATLGSLDDLRRQLTGEP